MAKRPLGRGFEEEEKWGKGNKVQDKINIICLQHDNVSSEHHGSCSAALILKLSFMKLSQNRDIISEVEKRMKGTTILNHLGALKGQTRGCYKDAAWMTCDGDSW